MADQGSHFREDRGSVPAYGPYAADTPAYSPRISNEFPGHGPHVSRLAAASYPYDGVGTSCKRTLLMSTVRLVPSANTGSGSISLSEL